ncbi:hypothetical protein NLU13_3355 [Sarocladium strictum]|uniref:Uncharacterized protein n=1 Tax=Sarocladium strictum TaxID=5046 RepID=A0AA39GLW6_SARSR|nr:hypothetical protein NLU13_3355 [Sarocladium strictum]
MATQAVNSTSKLDIIHAYRRLLRGGLQAVQFSSPARFVVRDQLRAAFRETPAPPTSPPPPSSIISAQAQAQAQGGFPPSSVSPSTGAAASSSSISKAAGFDAGVAKRTAWFLEAAARDRGVEHRVVKNLIKVRLARQRATKKWKVALAEGRNRKLNEQRKGVYEHFDMTVAMLNKSLGIALR